MTDTLKIIGWHSVEPMIPLDDWLCERAANCERLADQKSGTDREGWLQDAAYFKGAIALALTYKRLAEELERFKDGLKTIADGELDSIEEAMNYANTLLLSSEAQS